ncbi:hypothetical protein [Halorussus halobius]|uniref:hypothetical protein n=1 Tax=Halorussus halobius TaxID=1710537 RepID=UPI001091976F|nr:hypothetical protein [Halorussus halobius]
MPQRSDQHSSDSVAGEYADLLDDEPTDASADSDAARPESTPSDSSSVGQRLGSRATSLFSPRAFLYALVLLGGGTVAGNAFVPIPFVDSLAGLVGAFVGAFVLGLAVERSTVLESAVAGAAALGVGVLLTNLTLSVVGGLGVPMAAVGAGAGLVVGALGAHFGGDLRDGLTQDV